MLFSFLFIFFIFNTFAEAQANVSRSPSTQSISPRIAVDSSGNVHVVWAEYYTPIQNRPNPGRGDAFYSRYDIGTQQWSAPLNLSNSSLVFSSECRPVGIDIDGSNNVYVVYMEGPNVRLRILSGGSWGAPIDVVTSAPAQCDSVRIAVDASGNIFTCWWSNYGVYSRARVGGSWESVKGISSGTSKFCNIAVGSNAVYCVWMARGTGEYRAKYVQRSRSLNAPWSAVQDVVPGGGNEQMTPDVAVEANDFPNVIWSYKVNPGTSDWNYVEQVASWTGSSVGPPRNLSGQTVQLYPRS